MIVVDTRLIAFLYLPGEHSAAAEALLLHDGEWSVPRLWRSEFRNILATYMKQGPLTLEDAVAIYKRADSLIDGNEHDVAASDVLRLARDSGCSAYDCEFIALAKHLGVKLITADADLCMAFPECTVAMSAA